MPWCARSALILPSLGVSMPARTSGCVSVRMWATPGRHATRPSRGRWSGRCWWTRAIHRGSLWEPGHHRALPCGARWMQASTGSVLLSRSPSSVPGSTGLVCWPLRLTPSTRTNCGLVWRRAACSIAAMAARPGSAWTGGCCGPSARTFTTFRSWPTTGKKWLWWPV